MYDSVAFSNAHKSSSHLVVVSDDDHIGDERLFDNVYPTGETRDAKIK